jgi:hypothetical protein
MYTHFLSELMVANQFATLGPSIENILIFLSCMMMMIDESVPTTWWLKRSCWSQAYSCCAFTNYSAIDRCPQELQSEAREKKYMPTKFNTSKSTKHECFLTSFSKGKTGIYRHQTTRPNQNCYIHHKGNNTPKQKKKKGTAKRARFF